MEVRKWPQAKRARRAARQTRLERRLVNSDGRTSNSGKSKKPERFPPIDEQPVGEP
jgi:hypothetical protein